MLCHSSRDLLCAQFCYVCAPLLLLILGAIKEARLRYLLI